MMLWYSVYFIPEGLLPVCGIVGYFPKNQADAIDEHLLWRMVGNLLHRGPDFQDIYSQPGIGLGHTRLSIIDLDPRSNQPMVDPQSGCVIVFNGEIYNYKELREELGILGHIFSTSSDTEVILKAYEHWGVDCLKRFNGMWAFALYDPALKQLFAARDRFGIKPFVYGLRENGDLLFASEAKAIISNFPEFRYPDTELLLHFIQTGYFACYARTFFKDLTNLLPGHYFVIKTGETPVQKRYWHWSTSVRKDLPSDEEALSEFRSLLKDSIDLRFRSDVPVGSCLSGGLDSTTIVGLATENFGKQLSTFSCVYPGSPAFDESKYINMAVDAFDTKAYYTTPHYDDFVETMYQTVWEQDGPTGGPSILSQRAVMAEAKGKVTVLLDGQGADEVLGGYHSLFQSSLYSRMRTYRNKKTFGNWLKFHWAANAVKNRTKNKFQSFKTTYKYVKNNPVRFNSYPFPDSALEDFRLKPYAKDDLNTLLFEITMMNLPGLLHYEDRNSMAYSLESRLPFLDFRLVQYVFSLPYFYKIRGKTTKWLIYNTAKKVLPEEILNRKDKMGFTTPAHSWFVQDATLEHISHYFYEKDAFLLQLPPYYQELIKNYWERLYAKDFLNGDEISVIWRYVTACMFLEMLEKPIQPGPNFSEKRVSLV